MRVKTQGSTLFCGVVTGLLAELGMRKFKLHAIPPIVADPERPGGEHILRALRALEDHRLSDAKSHICRIEDELPLHRAWKRLLHGCIHLMENDLDQAADAFELATRRMDYEIKESPATNDMQLLDAAALERLGTVRRRAEQLDEARRNHQQAYELRKQCGSADGCWESAISLGLDAVVSRQFGDADDWFHCAIEHAARSSSPPIFTAIALEHLAGTLMESAVHLEAQRCGHPQTPLPPGGRGQGEGVDRITFNRNEEAVEAAKRGLDLRQTHDRESVDAVLSEALLGRARLRLAKAQCDQGQAATQLLHEALANLRGARDELLAFGPDYSDNVRTCEEQIDFAERLLKTAHEPA